jgi:hypothetical protein
VSGIGSGDQHVVDAHSRIVTAHIQSQSRIRIGLYCLSAFFMLAACFLAVFAPSGREVTTTIIAAALLLLSAGTAGFTFLRMKTVGIDISAGDKQG